MTRILGNDRDQWWVEECKAMENDAAFDNDCKISHLIGNTGSWNLTVSKVIKKFDGSLIRSQNSGPKRSTLDN